MEKKDKKKPRPASSNSPSHSLPSLGTSRKGERGERWKEEEQPRFRSDTRGVSEPYLGPSSPTSPRRGGGRAHSPHWLSPSPHRGPRSPQEREGSEEQLSVPSVPLRKGSPRLANRRGLKPPEEHFNSSPILTPPRSPSSAPISSSPSSPRGLSFDDERRKKKRASSSKGAMSTIAKEKVRFFSTVDKELEEDESTEDRGKKGKDKEKEKGVFWKLKSTPNPTYSVPLTDSFDLPSSTKFSLEEGKDMNERSEMAQEFQKRLPPSSFSIQSAYAYGKIFHTYILPLLITVGTKKKKIVHNITKAICEFIFLLYNPPSSPTTQPQPSPSPSTLLTPSSLSTSWCEVARRVWGVRGKWLQILHQIGVARQMTLTRTEIRILQETIHKYLNLIQPKSSEPQVNFFETVSVDLLEHLQTHSLDPCNFFVSSLPTSYLENLMEEYNQTPKEQGKRKLTSPPSLPSPFPSTPQNSNSRSPPSISSPSTSPTSPTSPPPPTRSSTASRSSPKKKRSPTSPCRPRPMSSCTRPLPLASSPFCSPSGASLLSFKTISDSPGNHFLSSPISSTLDPQPFSAIKSFSSLSLNSPKSSILPDPGSSNFSSDGFPSSKGGDLEKQILRWYSLLQSPHLLMSEITNMRNVLVNSKIRGGDLIGVKISSLPSPYREWFTNSTWQEKADFDPSLFLCRAALTPASDIVECFLDPLETIRVGVEAKDIKIFKRDSLKIIGGVSQKERILFTDPLFFLFQPYIDLIVSEVTQYLFKKSPHSPEELENFQTVDKIGRMMAVQKALKKVYEATGPSQTKELVSVITNSFKKLNQSWLDNTPSALFSSSLETAKNEIDVFVSRIPELVKSELDNQLQKTRQRVTDTKLRIRNIVKGITKKETCDWWLAHISDKADSYLEEQGFDNECLPPDYLDRPPPQLDSVRQNRDLLLGLIKGEVGDFIDLVTKEVYQVLDPLISDLEFVMEGKWKKWVEGVNFGEEELSALKSDHAYLTQVKKMDEEIKEQRKNDGTQPRSLQMTDVVPVSGLVMAKFQILVMECETAIEMWGRPPRSTASTDPPPGMTDSATPPPPLSPRSPRTSKSPKSPKSPRSPRTPRTPRTPASPTSPTSLTSPKSLTSPTSLKSPKSPPIPLTGTPSLPKLSLPISPSLDPSLEIMLSARGRRPSEKPSGGFLARVVSEWKEGGGDELKPPQSSLQQPCPHPPSFAEAAKRTKERKYSAFWGDEFFGYLEQGRKWAEKEKNQEGEEEDNPSTSGARDFLETYTSLSATRGDQPHFGEDLSSSFRGSDNLARRQLVRSESAGSLLEGSGENEILNSVVDGPVKPEE